MTQETIHATICMPGYTAKVRPASRFMRRLKVRRMEAYHARGPIEDYEADHLLALELGGAAYDQANVWPQPWGGPAGARAKDVIETRLHKAVCRGQVTLAAAQQCLMTDWRYCGTLP